MNNEITHVGVIDALLGLRLPGHMGRGVIRKQADDLDLVEILECHVIEVEQFAADNEVKQLRLHSFGHESHSQSDDRHFEFKHQIRTQALQNRVVPKVLDDMRMARTSRRHQQSMTNVGLIVNQSFAGQCGHFPARFVHD